MSEDLEKEILLIPGVVGTFVKDGIRYIMLKEMLPMSEMKVFEDRGWRVLITGEFVPLLKKGAIQPQERTGRYRPILGGISVGHYKITAGTLGILMKDKDGDVVILSNNHVLANSSSDKKSRAAKGDPILQPGRYDGGTIEKDTVAKLKDWIPIAEGGWNEVDAAIAKVDAGIPYKNEQLGLGKAKGIRYDVKENEMLFKSGRTSEVTKGPVYATGATVSVNYGEFIAYFKNQILVINPFGAPGDSGSAVFDSNMNLVGLLFAGSISHTVVCPIKSVVEKFGLSLLDGEAPPPPPPQGKRYVGALKLTGKGKGYAKVADYLIPIELDLTLEGTEEGRVEQ
ncbi:MAG: hypothetical protein QXS32_08845 [Candidatus Nezhaarchaeales archaeon]